MLLSLWVDDIEAVPFSRLPLLTAQLSNMILPPLYAIVDIFDVYFSACGDIVSDEELFVDNAEEYIRRDIEGSDVDTRRRAACDLVKVFSRSFERKITEIFGSYVQVCVLVSFMWLHVIQNIFFSIHIRINVFTKLMTEDIFGLLFSE
jgi:hypothetical protein